MIKGKDGNGRDVWAHPDHIVTITLIDDKANGRRFHTLTMTSGQTVIVNEG